MIIVKTKNDLLPGGDLSSPTIKDFAFTNKELEALNADTAVIKYECEIFGPMSGKYIHGKIRWEPDWEKISAQN